MIELELHEAVSLICIVAVSIALIIGGLTAPRCPECRSRNIRLLGWGKTQCRRCGAEFNDKR